MIKKGIYIAVVIALILVFYGFVKQISESLGAENRLYEAERSLKEAENENQRLKSELLKADKIESMEKIFRDKLNLARANETVIIIDPAAIENLKKSEQKVEEPPKIPNYQGWLKLFI